MTRRYLDWVLIPTLSVTWSGGGDIRDDKIKEWTLQNLKDVAMGFPDAVAACKQSTVLALMLTSLILSYQVPSV